MYYEPRPSTLKKRKRKTTIGAEKNGIRRGAWGKGKRQGKVREEMEVLEDFGPEDGEDPLSRKCRLVSTIPDGCITMILDFGSRTQRIGIDE